jgi:hypothetical protein
MCSSSDLVRQTEPDLVDLFLASGVDTNQQAAEQAGEEFRLIESFRNT